MELHETEIADARQRIMASGRDAEDFAFETTHLPPDPDAGAMFTARYEIRVANRKSGKSLAAVGGIGLDWLSPFEDALEEGYFD